MKPEFVSVKETPLLASPEVPMPMNHRSSRPWTIALALAFATVGLATSCKLTRGPMAMTSALPGDAKGDPIACVPAKKGPLCLKRSGDAAPCFAALVIQTTDSAQSLVYIVRGVKEDGDYETRRPYLFKGAKSTVSINFIQVFWGPGLVPDYQAQMTAIGDAARGWKGTLSGRYKTQYGIEPYDLEVHCKRDPKYREHLVQSPEWEIESTQQPF